MRRGWITYFRSNFCLAGLALASLYMTVLGFDNITAGYGYTQGLTESTLSLLTGAGAFTGILGSLCFPRLRRSIGPTRAGIAGFSLAVLAQTLSLASVFLPGTAFWPLARPDAPPSRVSVITLFCGIILARFGLWVSDLSVTQLLQERVPESRRGAISGVQSSLNMTMDMTKCLLVVIVPRATHFGFLAILSFLFWFIGWCFFVAYAWTTARRPLKPVEDGSGTEDDSLALAVTTLAHGDVTNGGDGVPRRPVSSEADPAEVQPLLEAGSDPAPTPSCQAEDRPGEVTAPPDTDREEDGAAPLQTAEAAASAAGQPESGTDGAPDTERP